MSRQQPRAARGLRPSRGVSTCDPLASRLPAYVPPHGCRRWHALSATMPALAHAAALRCLIPAPSLTLVCVHRQVPGDFRAQEQPARLLGDSRQRDHGARASQGGPEGAAGGPAHPQCSLRPHGVAPHDRGLRAALRCRQSRPPPRPDALPTNERMLALRRKPPSRCTLPVPRCKLDVWSMESVWKEYGLLPTTGVHSWTVMPPPAQAARTLNL